MLLCVFIDIDNEGVVEPDNEAPQEMGDESLEVIFRYFLPL